MLKRKQKILTLEQAEEIHTKDFFDMILPGTVKFLSDRYIVGDSYRCVWAIREYPPSTEEQAKLQKVEDTMQAIEEKMNAVGFTGRVKEAQVLYVLALSDYAEEDGFIDKLVGCFAANQSDEQLIAAVNTTFGTELASEDFTKIMENIRNTTEGK